MKACEEEGYLREDSQDLDPQLNDQRTPAQLKVDSTRQGFEQLLMCKSKLSPKKKRQQGYICRNAAAAGAKKIILGNIIYSTYVVLYNESEYQKRIKKYEIILPLKTFT